VIEVERSKN
jgi:hypothetical protein